MYDKLALGVNWMISIRLLIILLIGLAVPILGPIGVGIYLLCTLKLCQISSVSKLHPLQGMYRLSDIRQASINLTVGYIKNAGLYLIVIGIALAHAKGLVFPYSHEVAASNMLDIHLFIACILGGLMLCHIIACIHYLNEYAIIVKNH